MKHTLTVSLCAVIWCCVASLTVHSAQEDIVISAANYDVLVSAKDSQATVTLNFTATAINNRWAEVVISPLSAETSLQSAPAEVALLKDARNNKLVFKQKGTYSVKCRIILPVSASGQLKKITLPLVPSTFGGITVTIPEGGIDAVVSPPVTCEKKVHKSYTTLNINSPLADELTITWGPEAMMKQPYDATVNSASYVWIEKGLLTYNHSFTVTVGQQPLKSFRIALPENVRLTKFTGSTQTAVGIEKWTTLTENGKEYVEVTLDNPIYAAVFQGTLACEQTIADSANLTILPLEIPHTGKQSGKLTLVAAENYLIDEESVENLVRQNVYEATMTKTGKRLFYPYIYTGLPARLVLRARPKEPLVSAALETLYHLRPNSLQAVSRLALDVRNAPIDTVTLKYRPDSLNNNFFIKGDRVKNYRIIKDRIEVIFTEKFTGTTTLQIETAQDTPADAKLVFTPVEVVGVQESQSYAAVKLDEVECTVGEITKTTQIDPAQLPDWLASQKPSLAFVATAPAWELAARVAPLSPAVNASVTDIVRISADDTRREVTLKLSIKKSPLFAMTLRIPDSAKPGEVTSPLLKEWTYNQQTGLLQITFNTGLKGEYQIGLKLEGDLSATELLKLLPLEIAAPAPRQLEYYLAISAPKDIILVPQPTVGIQEISINKLPRTPSDTRLGFHSVQSQWTLEVRKTVEPTYLLANISAGLIAREGQVKVINAINYRVKSGSVRRLRLKLPPHALNTEITGDNIKNRSNSGNLWEIDLASRITANYTLYVQYEQTEPVFTPVEALDAELESGLVVVSAGSERTEVGYGADSRNAQSVPVGEAEPKIAQSILGQMPSAPSLAVSFTKPDARANFIIKTHELGTVLPAKVVSCDLFSLQQANGKLLTYFNTMIENTAKQYLEVKLPAGATLWGAYVDDKPVKAVTREAGQMMIPIASAVTTTQAAKTDKKQLSVVVAYVQEAGALGRASNVNLVMPQSDINIQGATWHLFLPAGYYVTSPGGNMELVYSDPQISYPSLPALAYDGLSSYLAKLYFAIPPWVRALFWVIAVLILIGVGIVLIAWIIRFIMAYLGIARIRMERVALVLGSGLLATLILFGLLVPGMMKGKRSVTAAKDESSFMDLVKAEKPLLEEIKEEIHGAWSSPDMEGDKMIDTYSGSELQEPEVQQQIELSNNTRQLLELRQYAQTARKDKSQKKFEYDKLAKKPQPVTPPPTPSELRLTGEFLAKKLDEKEREETTGLESEDTIETPSPLKGKGVYDTIGIGGGVAGGRGRRGGKRVVTTSQAIKGEEAGDEQTTTYYVKIQNDGNKESEIIVKSNQPQSDGWSVTYYGGDVNRQVARHLETPANGRLFGKTKQGRQSGALPITVAMPLHQPYYYAFESLYLGKSTGTVSFRSFSSGFMLFLQLAGCLVLGAILYLLSRRDIFIALNGAFGLAIIMFFGQLVTGGILKQVLWSGLWFSGLAAVILLVLYITKINHKVTETTEKSV